MASADTPAQRQECFIQDSNVSRFSRWLGERLDRPGSFRHEYSFRKLGLAWDCDSLHSAFGSYRWPLFGDKTSFRDNEAQLKNLQDRLRRALREEDTGETVETCKEIIHWGRVSGGNRGWIEVNRQSLVKMLKADGALIQQAPSEAELRARLHRFNSGFAKIHALYLEDFIIYDGRVGAALGELVGRWALKEGLEAIPELLRFPWGMPKEGPKAKAPKRRQPFFRGMPGPYPRLSQDAGLHALWAIRASWLLKRVLRDFRSKFDGGGSLRKLEAALFMVGYDLGPIECSKILTSDGSDSNSRIEQKRQAF